MNYNNWPFMSLQNIVQELSTNLQKGLDNKDVGRRMKEFGLNEIKSKKEKSLYFILISQFQDFMVLILLVATLISGLLGEYIDAITIIIIVILNAVLGFIQEYKAEKSLAALQDLASPLARVMRNGEKMEISATDLVPGDVVLIEAGDRLPADVRLAETNDLLTNEANLTGESLPVNKTASPLKNASFGSLGDLKNICFMGTLVTQGKGLGIVINTGMNTEMGKIAHLIQDTTEEKTPLQQRLHQLGSYLVLGCLLVCVLVVVMGIMQGQDTFKMFMAGVSLAVAAIPEGLPAIVTISLAIGVQRMLKRKALVRKLPAVETLGCATVICSDKTGTLTQNKMTVKKIFTGNKDFDVSGEGYDTEGFFKLAGEKVNIGNYPELQKTLEIATLCNNATFMKGKQKSYIRSNKSSAKAVGDPTEISLLVAATKAGLYQDELNRKHPRTGEVPFDSTRKKMTTSHLEKLGSYSLLVKGAPDVVLNSSQYYYDKGKIRKLTEDMRGRIEDVNESMASQALRNIAVAYKISENVEAKDDNNLIFVGIIGMIDPPRPEVIKSVLKGKQAGIKTIMITGDHKNTAIAIAKQLSILPSGGKVLTGKELDVINDNNLENLVESTYVYARVDPEHKLRVVKALKKKGNIVAMTGDGVNDAPAVKEADIGIAMGISGTDVTKESAFLILLDDNYATIIRAIEEGRSIYDNIRKFIRFLLSCNVGEILTMFIAMSVGLPLPLKPIQILWVNLVTDGLPALALGLTPAEKDIMKRPPRHPKESIFARGLWRKILFNGSLIGVATVGIFAYYLLNTGDLVRSQTVAFSTLILTQLFHVFDCQVESDRENTISLWANKLLILAVTFSVMLLFVVVYNPFLQSIFTTIPLVWQDWFLIVIVSLLPSFFTIVKRKLKILLHYHK